MGSGGASAGRPAAVSPAARKVWGGMTKPALPELPPSGGIEYSRSVAAEQGLNSGLKLSQGGELPAQEPMGKRTLGGGGGGMPSASVRRGPRAAPVYRVLDAPDPAAAGVAGKGAGLQEPMGRRRMGAMLGGIPPPSMRRGPRAQPEYRVIDAPDPATAATAAAAQGGPVTGAAEATHLRDQAMASHLRAVESARVGDLAPATAPAPEYRRPIAGAPELVAKFTAAQGDHSLPPLVREMRRKAAEEAAKAAGAGA